MAKKSGGDSGVYRVIDVIGTSKTSWEEAARHAVETASKSLREPAHRRGHQDGEPRKFGSSPESVAQAVLR